jgi:hypothetical protein
MATTFLNASNLFLDDVHHLLQLEQRSNVSFTTLLSLEPLTEIEQQEILQISNDFWHYFSAGKVYEGLVKFIALAPLMRLAGFYQHPIEIKLEERIAEIDIEDEDTKITGRMDILAVNKAGLLTKDVLWILIVETKNSLAEAFAGLPQLLTYAYSSLEHQESVWGLTTNGLRYQFVYLQPGNPPTYYLLPELNLIDTERSLQILQVLKAICKL